MFVLVKLKDTIRTPPDQFNLPLEKAIADELNKRFSNKVIVNVGLCIVLYDIVKLEQSFIYHGDGAANTEVHFRFVVFRPFVGEVLVGKLRSCSRDGVFVSLGFFDDILIPRECLQEPSRFDEKEQLWVWEYDSDEGKHEMFMDVGERIRFKVKEELFKDTSPPGPTNDAMSADQQRKTPYQIKCTISDPGLGLITWWQ
ncbi:DNA-directed RNA polymerase III subunit RPC8 [Halotydeus destructor]|nr:DNA-directed RNA polymerase III subunit RPC8 [Halotydeus destructor]